MKRIILDNPPDNFVLLSEVYASSYIGLKAKVDLRDQYNEENKYILMIRPDGRYIFLGLRCNFWTQDKDFDSIMKGVIVDSRCKLFVFDNLEEMTEWALRKD